MKTITILSTLFLAFNLWAIEIGKTPKQVLISEDDGGYVLDGSEWNSNTVKDKMYVMFYVDPDEKDINEHFSKALKAKKYNKKRFGSIAVVNLAATWKPNFIIESILKSKQEEYPNTIYVKDKNKVLVNAWDIEDDASNILLFNRDGVLLFYKSGAMTEEDMQKIYKLIEENI